MIRRLTIAVAAFAIVSIGSLYLYERLLSVRAEFMLRTAYELSEQRQAPTLADIRERYGNRLKPRDGCTASDCGYTVVLSNRVLAALHAVPYTELESYFWVRAGRVTETLLDYTARANDGHTFVSHVQIDFCEDCQSFSINPWGDSSPLDKNGTVQIGNQAPANEKRTALSLNTSCLTKAGCYNIADLLPTVWKRTADNKIACRIQNHEGWVRKPVGWP